MAKVLLHPRLGCILSTLCTRQDREHPNTFPAYFKINFSRSNPNTLKVYSLGMGNCRDLFFTIRSSVRRPLFLSSTKGNRKMYININIRESYNLAEFNYISVIYVYICVCVYIYIHTHVYIYIYV